MGVFILWVFLNKGPDQLNVLKTLRFLSFRYSADLRRFRFVSYLLLTSKEFVAFWISVEKVRQLQLEPIRNILVPM